MSENTYELELSASCQNLSNQINSTKRNTKGTRFSEYSGPAKYLDVSSLHLDGDEKILTEAWNSYESIYSHDYYKYRRTMEDDANNKDLVNSVFHDYEKLLREECDCTKRIIPGGYVIQVLPTTRSFIISMFVFVTFKRKLS